MKPNIDYCRMKYPNLLFYPRNYSPEINKLLSFMASTPQKPRCYGVFRFIAIPIQQIHKNMGFSSVFLVVFWLVLCTMYLFYLCLFIFCYQNVIKYIFVAPLQDIYSPFSFQDYFFRYAYNNR